MTFLDKIGVLLFTVCLLTIAYLMLKPNPVKAEVKEEIVYPQCNHHNPNSWSGRWQGKKNN